MIRGTTAQFKFKLPYAKEELEWVTIKFWQNNNPNKYLPIIKNLDHCDEFTPKELCVSLIPEETTLFVDKYKAYTQLRAQANDGTVFGSRPILITVYPMPDDIINEDIILPLQPDDGETWIILDGENIQAVMINERRTYRINRK